MRQAKVLGKRLQRNRRSDKRQVIAENKCSHGGHHSSQIYILIENLLGSRCAHDNRGRVSCRHLGECLKDVEKLQSALGTLRLALLSIFNECLAGACCGVLGSKSGVWMRDAESLPRVYLSVVAGWQYLGLEALFARSHSFPRPSRGFLYATGRDTSQMKIVHGLFYSIVCAVDSCRRHKESSSNCRSSSFRSDLQSTISSSLQSVANTATAIRQDLDKQLNQLRNI